MRLQVLLIHTIRHGLMVLENQSSENAYGTEGHAGFVISTVVLGLTRTDAVAGLMSHSCVPAGELPTKSTFNARPENLKP